MFITWKNESTKSLLTAKAVHNKSINFTKIKNVTLQNGLIVFRLGTAFY